MAKLIIHENDRSKTHDILDEALIIGSKEGVAVRLSDPDAGAEHCRIRNVPGVGYKLIDLESRSGTKVNGAFVNQHLLRTGDVIQIGQVRIDFSVDATVPHAVPAAPAPPPAAAPARGPSGVRLTPGRAYVGPATARARPGPARAFDEERESRPPRYSRRADGAPLVLGVGVGVLVFVLVIVVLVTSSGPGYNETIYQELLSLQRRAEGRSKGEQKRLYRLVQSRAKDADPDGSQKWLKKIKSQEEQIRRKLELLEKPNLYNLSWAEFNRNEIWQKHENPTPAEVVARWTEYIERYGGLGAGSELDQVRRARRKLMEARARVAGAGPVAPRPTGGDAIDRIWAKAKQNADSKEREDRFGDAIEVVSDFLDRNRLKITPQRTREWERRARQTISAIEERARIQFEKLDRKAKLDISSGRTEAAIGLYKRIEERFGIRKYEELASEARRKYE